jgi:hypothetical protein
MLLNQNIAIKGKFGYKIFDVSGNLKKEVKDIPNFITNTGLVYPSIYNFADCFRFISLGFGTDQNTIIGVGTTGLAQASNDFSYIGSRTSYGDITSSQYDLGSCGYRESLGQVSLSRGWRVPIGSGHFDQPYSFSELMLSPGKPTGTHTRCGCNFGINDGEGVDASIIADYYDSLVGNKSICNANKAFSRIVLDTPISVSSMDFVIITYDLNVNYDTGINQFEISIPPVVNFSPTTWTGNIIGSHNLLHHGVKLINDSNIVDKSFSRNQIFSYSWSLEGGESFIPLWGAPLEPSCSKDNLLAYFSTDNVNFLCNQFSGGHLDTGNWQPYSPTGFAPSNGLMSPISFPTSTTSNQLLNIRTNNSNLKYPDKYNILLDSTTTSNANYIPDFSFKTTNLSFNNRTGSILYSCVFTNLHVNDWKPDHLSSSLVRSMVLNYVDANANTLSQMYPFLDLLFTGTQGEGLVGIGDYGPWTYNDPSTNYYPLGNGGDLTMSFKLSWGSDCPSNVIGCT